MRSGMRSNLRKIIFVVIIFICIISLGFIIETELIKDSANPAKEDTEIIEEEELEENFNNIFENNISLNNNDLTSVIKSDLSKDIIYSSYENKENKNNYKLNVNIPQINIKSDVITKINKEIELTFKAKTNNIIESKDNKEQLYTVEYKGYINYNILSLIIKSTLREGENAQRVIIKTYNYNLTTNQEINLKDVLIIKSLDEDKIQKSIISKINTVNKEAEALQATGYSSFTRDIESSIYKIEHTNTFILGENMALYLIYPYGNNSYTSQVDMLVIK